MVRNIIIIQKDSAYYVPVRDWSIGAFFSDDFHDEDGNYDLTDDREPEWGDEY